MVQVIFKFTNRVYFIVQKWRERESVKENLSYERELSEVGIPDLQFWLRYHHQEKGKREVSLFSENYMNRRITWEWPLGRQNVNQCTQDWSWHTVGIYNQRKCLCKQ